MGCVIIKIAVKGKDFVLMGIKCDDVLEEDDGPLHNADPNCKHKVESLWSGVRCSKCGG